MRLTDIVWLSKVAAAPPFPGEPPAVNVEEAIALDDRFTGVVTVPRVALPKVTGCPVKTARSLTVAPLLSLLRLAVIVDV